MAVPPGTASGGSASASSSPSTRHTDQRYSATPDSASEKPSHAEHSCPETFKKAAPPLQPLSVVPSCGTEPPSVTTPSVGGDGS